MREEKERCCREHQANARCEKGVALSRGLWRCAGISPQRESGAHCDTSSQVDVGRRRNPGPRATAACPDSFQRDGQEIREDEDS